jgi:hypothetical protein
MIIQLISSTNILEETHENKGKYITIMRYFIYIYNHPKINIEQFHVIKQ